ncbi:MAG: hypothetical protein Q4F66_09240 [Clostridium sp.]|nr:hypothetical protein [Clostridium sp.]
MKKIIKKLVVGTTLCMMLSTTAFAAKKEFNFSLSKGNSGYTATNAKSDNEGYAYVTVTDSNLISSDKVSYVVTSSDKATNVTAGLTRNGAEPLYKQSFRYKSGYAKKGAAYRLHIKTINNSLRIEGRWNS